jgi:hypothetical protein
MHAHTHTHRVFIMYARHKRCTGIGWLTFTNKFAALKYENPIQTYIQGRMCYNTKCVTEYFIPYIKKFLCHKLKCKTNYRNKFYYKISCQCPWSYFLGRTRPWIGKATDYGLDGPGIEYRWGEIFRCPDWPWGPPSLLYNRYRVFHRGKVRLGRAVDHSRPSNSAVKKG